MAAVGRLQGFHQILPQVCFFKACAGNVGRLQWGIQWGIQILRLENPHLPDNFCARRRVGSAEGDFANIRVFEDADVTFPNIKIDQQRCGKVLHVLGPVTWLV